MASALAINVLTACARLHPLSVDAVLASLYEANRVIVAAAAEQGKADGMRTTVTGFALIETSGGGQSMVFNVGDSRAYRFAGGRLEQITVDHSEAPELVVTGR